VENPRSHSPAGPSESAPRIVGTFSLDPGPLAPTCKLRFLATGTDGVFMSKVWEWTTAGLSEPSRREIETAIEDAVHRWLLWYCPIQDQLPGMAPAP